MTATNVDALHQIRQIRNKQVVRRNFLEVENRPA